MSSPGSSADLSGGADPLRGYLVAVAVGIALVWAVPAVVALVAMWPGHGAALRAMKTAGMPLGLYSLVLSYLPMLAVSFAAGAAMRRYAGGVDARQLLVCGAPWVLHALALLTFIYFGTDVSWRGEIPGVAVVPFGLLLAVFVPRHQHGRRNQDGKEAGRD